MPDGSRSRSSSPYVVEEVAVSLHRSAAGACWRWRTEISAFLVLAGSFLTGWRLLGSWSWPLVILGVIALVTGVLPWSRRFLVARFWALLTRHRLQRAFWELRLHTRAGSLPLIPWIFATSVGCRVLVLLRAGMAFDDFEDSAAAFAAACAARDCRVTASARWSSLLFIDIIRRDVLGSGVVITSPLMRLPVFAAAAIDADQPAPAWPESPWEKEA